MAKQAHKNVAVEYNASTIVAATRPRPTALGFGMGESLCTIGSIDPASENGTGNPHSGQHPTASAPFRS